jgi:hypothetical protein
MPQPTEDDFRVAYEKHRPFLDQLGCASSWQAVDNTGRRCLMVYGDSLDAAAKNLIHARITEVPVTIENIGQVLPQAGL